MKRGEREMGVKGKSRGVSKEEGKKTMKRNGRANVRKRVDR